MYVPYSFFAGGIGSCVCRVLAVNNASKYVTIDQW